MAPRKGEERVVTTQRAVLSTRGPGVSVQATRGRQQRAKAETGRVVAWRRRPRARRENCQRSAMAAKGRDARRSARRKRRRCG
eukprot:1171837-Pleurochrysis_carterae.AAC.1